MKNSDKRNFSDKIRRRIRLLWVTLVAMLIYMVVVGETGGDSRIMTDFANTVSSLLFFGGLIYIVYRISYNRKLLQNRMLLKEQFLTEQDERNQYLHDKSGGTVLDILLLFLLFVTTTTARYNMAAFYTSVTILAVALFAKMAAYFVYSRKAKGR